MFEQNTFIITLYNSFTLHQKVWSSSVNEVSLFLPLPHQKTQYVEINSLHFNNCFSKHCYNALHQMDSKDDNQDLKVKAELTIS